jgi:BirA family biotin operon repressor/biotin-[acetyl-CoA-carboxylase] ligase
MKNEILSILPGDHPWAEYLHIENCLPSTNQELKHLAENGAPEGTTLIAREQTAGRGRMGRSFYSQKDTGLYFSCLLRPNCVPTDLMHLTCAVGVAVCKAVQKAAGVTPQIKWINDLVLENKKLGGILTELSIDPNTGLVAYAIVGIGINCLQKAFPEELAEIATSLRLAAGKNCTPACLAAHLMDELESLSHTLLTEKDKWMDAYRGSCITIGKEVKVLNGENTYSGTAVNITPDGSLVVSLADGTEKVVSSGEASVRGLFGYV